jgi:transcription initiation factor TFIID subunit TAF12
MEISLISVGSSQILRLPQPRTSAARRFWSLRETCRNSSASSQSGLAAAGFRGHSASAKSPGNPQSRRVGAGSKQGVAAAGRQRTIAAVFASGSGAKRRRSLSAIPMDLEKRRENYGLLWARGKCQNDVLEYTLT